MLCTGVNVQTDNRAHGPDHDEENITHVVGSRKAPEADRRTINQPELSRCTAEHVKAAAAASSNELS